VDINMDKSKKNFTWSVVLTMGSMWGLSEAAMGMHLRGSCARMVTGSVMTGVAIFFMSGALAYSGKRISLIPVLGLAIIFKMTDAFLLKLPLLHGAIGNPIFAFVTEMAALLMVWQILSSKLKSNTGGRAILGGMSALLAVNLFPLVKFATGIPACVVTGTQYPLALYYAHYAIAISAISCPLGMMIGEKLSMAADKSFEKNRMPIFIPQALQFAPIFVIMLAVFIRVI
jgi:hypothetical protein